MYPNEVSICFFSKIISDTYQVYIQGNLQIE